MYLVAAYRATERGAQPALREMRAEHEREQQRLARQAYEAHLEEIEHLAQIKREAEERAEQVRLAARERADAMAAEMRGMGYRYKHTYREIERRACLLFHVKPSEVRSNRRAQSIVFVRQFIAYWACRLTPLSLPQIGRLMGGRDHTTCLHHKRKYPDKRAKMGRYLRPAR